MRERLKAFVFRLEFLLGVHLRGESFGKRLSTVEKLSRIRIQTDPKKKARIRNRIEREWEAFLKVAEDAEHFTGEELQKVVH